MGSNQQENHQPQVDPQLLAPEQMASREAMQKLLAKATETKRKRLANRKDLTPFLQKLGSLLDDPQYASLLHWDRDGTTFIVEDTDELERLLPHWFKHHHYSSFVRQLNMYGFHKMVGLRDNTMNANGGPTRGPYRWANPLFVREYPVLRYLLRPSKSSKSDKNADSDATPKKAKKKGKTAKKATGRKKAKKGNKSKDAEDMDNDAESDAATDQEVSTSSDEEQEMPNGVVTAAGDRSMMADLGRQVQTLTDQHEMIVASIQQLATDFNGQMRAMREVQARHEHTLQIIVMFLREMCGRMGTDGQTYANILSNLVLPGVTRAPGATLAGGENEPHQHHNNNNNNVDGTTASSAVLSPGRLAQARLMLPSTTGQTAITPATFAGIFQTLSGEAQQAMTGPSIPATSTMGRTSPEFIIDSVSSTPSPANMSDQGENVHPNVNTNQGQQFIQPSGHGSVMPFDSPSPAYSNQQALMALPRGGFSAVQVARMQQENGQREVDRVAQLQTQQEAQLQQVLSTLTPAAGMIEALPTASEYESTSPSASSPQSISTSSVQVQGADNMAGATTTTTTTTTADGVNAAGTTSEMAGTGYDEYFLVPDLGPPAVYAGQGNEYQLIGDNEPLGMGDSIESLFNEMEQHGETINNDGNVSSTGYATTGPTVTQINNGGGNAPPTGYATTGPAVTQTNTGGNVSSTGSATTTGAPMTGKNHRGNVSSTGYSTTGALVRQTNHNRANVSSYVTTGPPVLQTLNALHAAGALIPAGFNSEREYLEALAREDAFQKEEQRKLAAETPAQYHARRRQEELKKIAHDYEQNRKRKAEEAVAHEQSTAKKMKKDGNDDKDNDKDDTTKTRTWAKSQNNTD
ncbi:MAG: Replication factor C (RF-C) subunit [Watsoniomyces obsoletus]|nr:MAG: Replication factor C (RF-C) subunit [Watsoniomyces obsoletus]